MTEPDPLRVLHLLDHSLPEQDGYSFRTAAILREQAALGWHTLPVTSSKHPPGAASETVDSIEYLRTPGSGSMLAGWPGFDQLDVIRTLEKHVAQLLDTFRPDILQAHSPCLTGLAALRAARGTGIPVVYEMRSSWEDAAVDQGVTTKGSLRYRLSRALETRVLRNAAAVTTICTGLKNDIVGRGIPESKVTVIPNAVDADQFSVDESLRREIVARHGGEDIRLIGFIGSFFSWEGLDLLLEAMAEVARQCNDIRLLLVGGGTNDAALRRKADALGLGEQVIFTGRVPHEEVSSYYAALDLLVYPRISCELNDKVTPLKPLEAMAHGALVLASDVGGHRELISNGDNGLLFAPDDAGMLSRAIMDALADQEGAAMRESGRRFVTRERTWKNSVAAYGPVYESLRAAAATC